MPDPAAPAVTPTAGTGRRRWSTAVFVAGVMVLAFNLRGAIAATPPVFPELAARLHLSPVSVAALAAVPVLCFAVFSPAAPPLSRRFGEERILLAALAVLAGGLLVRGAFPGPLLFGGTVLASGAIALMNVLLPSLVKRRLPAQTGLLIGAYLLSLSAGGVLGPLIAVPAFRALGNSIVVALGAWALPAIAAALVWLPQWRFRTLPGTPGVGRPGARSHLTVSRHLLAWQVMGFMGLQSLTYYATLSWLPVLLRDRGAGAVNAGTLLALMNLGGAATALLLPVLAHRVRDHRALAAAAVTASAAGLAGVWLAPLAAAVAWALLLGLGQGAAFGLAIYLMAARAPDPVSAARLSAFAQGGGYLVATAGPLLTGLLYSATGGWSAPMVALLLISGCELAVGWQAGRDRVLPAPAG